MGYARTFHAFVRFLDALMQPVTFQTGADDHHNERHQQFHLVGVTQRGIFGNGEQLLHCFRSGEETSDEEQQRRHHERGEILGPIQPERMIAVRLMFGEAAAYHEHDLIGAVGDGVHRFGKHCGRSGEERCRELGDGHTNVGSERRFDGRTLVFRFLLANIVCRIRVTVVRTTVVGILRFVHCLSVSFWS